MYHISVVIPCYNAASWISETLRSALAQDIPNLEVIVIDDGSTDGSGDIVARDFPSVRLVRTINGGPSRARNLGTALAKGEFIQYLDADDLLAPGKLKIQLAALEASGAEVAYGDWQYLELQLDNGFVPTRMICKTLSGDPEIALFTDFWCPPAAYLFRSTIIARMSGWNERLPIIQDARFALDCALHGARFAYVSGVMAYYRVHGSDSVSRRNVDAFRRDCLLNALEVEAWWQEWGKIGPAHRAALLGVYAMVARGAYASDQETFEIAYQSLKRLKPDYVPSHPKLLALLSRLVGYRYAEQCALYYRWIKAWWKPLGS